MTRRGIRNLLGLFALAAAALAWLLVPNPFLHGVITGAVGVLGLVLAAGVVFARIMMRRRLDSGLKPPPLPVASWDYALDAEDLAGTAVPFARYKERVLVLNFWATWCAPCLAEMPSLERLLTATADLDVALACLTREQSDTVRGFAEKRGLNVPVLVYRGETPACFLHRGIPATYVLDRTGRIVMQHVGAARWDDPGVVAFIRGLAASPA